MAAKRLGGETSSGGETTRGGVRLGGNVLGAKRPWEETVWGRNDPEPAGTSPRLSNAAQA